MKWLTAEKWYPANYQGNANAKKRKWTVISTFLILAFVVLYAGFSFFQKWYDDRWDNEHVTLVFDNGSEAEERIDASVMIDKVIYPIRDVPKEYVGVRVIYEPAPRFTEMMRGAFPLLPVVFAGMIFMIIINYRSYRKPSKSVYVMKRLSNRWEMHRRCLLVPVAEFLLHLIVCAVICIICYSIYKHVMLPQRLPKQFDFNFWRTFVWWN